MLKQFRFKFEELAISPSDLAELMGFENEIPEPFPELISTGLEKSNGLCDIRGGYKIFNSIDIQTKNQSIQIEDKIFNPSKVVINQLKNATEAALFICTAGAKISSYANKISTTSDPMLGYVFDTIGSVVVDKAAEKMAQQLKELVQKKQMGISDSFSPGYCEWSVADQQKLFSLLPDKFCGVQLSSSSLMYPIKSVSGIIGIGTGLEQKGYQCHWCNDLNCIYGKIKRQKKKQN
jgi:hypothetical protein